MLKQIKSSTLRDNLADVLNATKKEHYFIVTKRNRPISALIDIDFLEDLLATTNKDYLESVKQARADVKAGRTFSHLEVFGDLE